MENWDLAQKYAEISANAYGTAAEKMTAYTDSIEAAQNRVTASIEDFALRLNSSNLIKAFYNTISYLIDNLDKLAATIGLVIVATNASSISRGAVGGLSTLGGKLSGLGASLNMIGNMNTKQGVKGALGGLGAMLDNMAEQAYLEKTIGLYEQSLLNRIASLDAETQMSAKVLQTQILSNNAEIQAVQMEYLNTDMTEEDYKAKLQKIPAYNALSQAMQAEIAATENLAKVKNNAAAKQAVLDNVNASTAGKTAGISQYKLGAIGGIGGIIGGVLGGSAGYTTGESLGEGFGSVGTIVGSMAGMKAGSSLAGIIGKLVGGAGLKAALGAVGGPVGWASLIVTAVSGVYSLIKKGEEKALKKAQEQFTEVKEEYDNLVSGSADAIEYDKLVKGVDSLGNNVSLTDEEYQKFIETSNTLAEIFPELVVRTDAAGNSFLGLNGKVGTITDSVNKLVEAQQSLVDAQLLNPQLMGEDLGENQGGLLDLQKELESLEKEREQAYEGLRNSYDPRLKEGVNTDSYERYSKVIEDLDKQIENVQKQIDGFTFEYQDYIDATIRQNSALKESYESLDDVEKTAVDAMINSIDWSQYGEDDAEQMVEDIENMAEEALSHIDEIAPTLDIYYNLDTSMAAGDYESAREQIKNTILSWDFMTEDEQGRLLIELGFTMNDDGDWIDTTNPLATIFEEGLNTKVLDGYGKAMSRATIGEIYSVEQLQKAYEILKNSADNAVYSAEQFQYLVVRSDVKDSSLTELASQYENFADIAEEDLTQIQKIQKQIIEEELDLYAKQLGAVEGKYDDIIEKVRIMGDLTYGGVSEKTPEEVLNQAEDYMGFADYLADFDGKNWDAETLNNMMNYEDLVPYLAKGNIAGLKSEIQDYLDSLDDTINQTYQNIVAKNDEASKVLLEQNKDQVDAFAENYGIDLTNFTNLKEAESYLNALTASIMTDDYDTWLSKMAQYYEKDLENFRDASSWKAAINREILRGLTTQEQNMIRGQASTSWKNMTDEQKAAYYSEGGTAREAWQTYYGQQLQDYQSSKLTQEKLEQAQQDFQAILDSMPTFTTSIGSAGSGSGSGSDWDLGDELEALKGLIDKEWEAMQVFDELTGKVIGETAYFDKMNDIISQQLTYYRNQLANAQALGLEQSEILDIQGKIIELEVEQANLDDERIQDEIELAEAKNYSLQTIIKLNQELVKTADTEEDRVEYQNQLNEAIREEFEERKRIREFEQDFIDRAMDRQSGTSWSSGGVYDELVNMKRQSYEQDAQDALRLRENWYQYYIGTYMDEGMSWDEAKKRAEQAQEVQEATQEYLEAIDNQAQLVIDSVTDKLDEIQQKIDDLEKTKPQEWTSIDQIKQFSEETIGLLEAKIPELNAALADTSMMTDEQIQDLVDQLNEVVVALHEAQIEMRENIRDFQDTQYDAIVSKVEEMKQELQDEIDALEDEYDDLIKPLQEANDERERAIELEDLLRAKQDAYKEKERVYREGIGWVKDKKP